MTSSALFAELGGLPIDKLRAFLAEHEQSFEQSQLYSPATERKYVDTEQRVSEFRAIVSKELFEHAEALVAALNADHGAAAGLHFSLVRNDVTEIRYRRGGFFKRHQDFLSVQGNVVQEHTMLACVTPDALAADVRGGRTILHTLGGSHASRATTTPGSCLVFRKDLEHEGEMLEAGEKHLLSLNLWAVRART
jgi:hypothetical protein